MRWRQCLVHGACVLLLACTSVAHAGWVGSVRPDDVVFAGRVSIQYAAEPGAGARTFDGAVEDLARVGALPRLRIIALHALFDDAAFQADLVRELQSSAPQAWTDALRSSGDMRHPKLRALRRPFESAVLATSAVRAIDATLAGRGLQVSGASTEKLALVDGEGGRALRSFLWLEVSAKPD